MVRCLREQPLDRPSALPTGPSRPRRGRPGARRAPAAGRRPRGRTAARAGGPGDGQDDDAGRGGRRPGAPRRRGSAGAHLLPQGRRAAARPGDGAAGRHDLRGHLQHLPLLRLLPRPALRPHRPLRRTAAAAVGARAGRRALRAADHGTGGGGVAGGPAGCRRHPRLRPRGPGRAGPRPRARVGPAGPRGPGSVRGCGGLRGRRILHGAVPRRDGRPERHRLPRPGGPCGDRGDAPPRRAAGRVRPRLRRRIPGHRPQPGGAAAPGRR